MIYFGIYLLLKVTYIQPGNDKDRYQLAENVSLCFRETTKTLMPRVHKHPIMHFLGTRGTVLHHSAETVLCFGIQIVVLLLLSSCLVILSEYQQRVKMTCLWCRTGPVCLPQFLLFVHCPYFACHQYH